MKKRIWIWIALPLFLLVCPAFFAGQPPNGGAKVREVEQGLHEVSDRTVRWPLTFQHPSGLGESDHRLFEAFRVPAANFYSGKSPDTHVPTDTPDKIDHKKAEAIARQVFEIARDLGERNLSWK